MSHTQPYLAGDDRPQYRLTRRGRAVVLFLGIAVALVIGVVLAGGSVATGEPERTRTVVVTPGDSLWALASQAAADTGYDDVRGMIRHIQDLNDLDGVALDAGQRLVVPVG